MAQIKIECRVQYQRGGEWFTIDEAGEAALILEGDIVDALARWVAWFEARRFDSGPCAVCLWRPAEQGHAPDCIYAVSKALLTSEEAPGGA